MRTLAFFTKQVNRDFSILVVQPLPDTYTINSFITTSISDMIQVLASFLVISMLNIRKNSQIQKNLNNVQLKILMTQLVSVIPTLSL